jgi:hypothetical protein
MKDDVQRELPEGLLKPYREAMRKDCGVLMALLLGHSRVPNPLSEPQNTPVNPDMRRA